VKRFILSDLHIGHPDAQYDVMEKVIEYISANCGAGDEIWGLGDWFHADDGIGFENCLARPETKKFGELAVKVPTSLIPGNHDDNLEKYQGGRKLPDPVGSIVVIKPFMDNGLWYCHGHEFDPSLLPLSLWGHLISLLGLKKRTTPGAIKTQTITKQYLTLVQAVHIRALLDSCDRQGCRGVVFGHTHLPVYQESPHPGVPLLVNDGDMRGSSTFLIIVNNDFQFMTWDPGRQGWQTISIHSH
jgi:UDP-2,3-diacylglucosamine pyrophosphatase LpxH